MNRPKAPLSFQLLNLLSTPQQWPRFQLIRLRKQSGVIVGIATAVAIVVACCFLVLLLLYRKKTNDANTKEPVGTQDLKIWIKQDDEANSTLNIVKVADWKKIQLTAIGEDLYLTPRPAAVNDTNTHVFSNSSLESNRGNNSPLRPNSNNQQLSVKEVEALHSIQQQLHYLSGVNPLTVQTTQSTAGVAGDSTNITSPRVGSSTRNPLTTTHSTATSSPSHSPTRGSTFSNFVNNIASRNSSPDRTSKDSQSFADNLMPAFRSSIVGMIPHKKTSSATSTAAVDCLDNVEQQQIGDGNGDEAGATTDDNIGRPSLSLDMGSVYKNEN